MRKTVKVRTPGNRIVVHARRSRVGERLCAGCKRPMGGAQRLVPSKLGKLSKTKKGVNRVYGGYFCGGCSRRVLREKAFSL